MHEAPLVYTMAEAAEALGVSRTKLYRLVGDGTIPSLRIGKSRRIRRDSLVDLVGKLEQQNETDRGAA
jgi:excisionase family DNA binding protein